jgi:hypothetical protein
MSERTNVLRDFVRGESDSDALSAVGASLAIEDDVVRLDEPAGAPVYGATATDVAVGMLANWALGTPLRDWARVLLATGMVDLSSLEDDPLGEALLNALWDAAEGAGPSESQLEIARVVATQEGDT